LEVLAQNPKVSFNVTTNVQMLPADRPQDCSVAYTSVVGFGRVRMVDDPVEKLAALEAVMLQYYPKNDAWEYPEKVVAACTVWCIEIEHLTGKRKRPPREE
ncbi:MAG: pyridoxamine 5'-phosphate oxidase family protein, partial [Deltaproteobacteria bacterium]|nr:pyridoxamine 5'-phosphate oxidase family protein [Deltaproteobacteria bacterium]